MPFHVVCRLTHWCEKKVIYRSKVVTFNFQLLKKGHFNFRQNFFARISLSPLLTLQVSSWEDNGNRRLKKNRVAASYDRIFKLKYNVSAEYLLVMYNNFLNISATLQYFWCFFIAQLKENYVLKGKPITFRYITYRLWS